MPRDKSYGAVSKALHWTIAALFLAQITLGFVMERVKSMALQFELIQWHKSFGFLILTLAVFRIAWHFAAGRPPYAPGMSAFERHAATTVQGALLALTIAAPLAGWALASTSTLHIPSFAFNLLLIPHLPLETSPQAEAFWRQAHGWLAYTALALAAGHAAAAIRHHVILGDESLAHMLPDALTGKADRAFRRTKDDA